MCLILWQIIADYHFLKASFARLRQACAASVHCRVKGFAPRIGRFAPATSRFATKCLIGNLIQAMLA
jgi:hypothetical protein